MKVRRRFYAVSEVNVDGVKLPVLVLKESSEVEVKLRKRSGDLFDLLSEALHKELLEISDKKGDIDNAYIEYETKSGKLLVRVGSGKGLKGEMVKWPTKLKRVAVVKESPRELDLSSLKWHRVPEDVFVYEGKPKGEYSAILLDTEDGMYVVLSDKALEEEVKEWEFAEEGAEEGEEE